MSPNYDIVIIGSGLTGLLLANFLQKYQFKVALLEKGKISTREDIRSTAINLAAADILASIGVWDELKANSGLINDILIMNNQSDAQLHFNNSQAEMGYILLNHEFKQVLLSKVRASEQIDIYEDFTDLQIEQKANLVRITNKKSIEIRAKLAIAAQGKFGDWLKKFKIDNLRFSYDQTALTFLIKHEKPHLNLAVEHFLPDGPFATLPLKDYFHSSVVWSLKNEVFAQVNQLDNQQKTAYFQKYMPECLGRAEIVSELQSYPLSGNFAFKFYRERILFLGDAIHSMHPLAGQGFNLTILDIAKFVLQLSQRESLGLDIGSRDFMQNFAASIFKDDALLVGGVTVLDKIFSNNNKICDLMRDTGLRMIDKLSPVKQSLIAYAMGIR